MIALIAVFLFFLLVPFAQVEPEPFKLTWHLVVAIVAAIYEAIVRIIPTIGNYSAIAKIIEILVWISNFLNRKKKK
jgi:hypothetical protein